MEQRIDESRFFELNFRAVVNEQDAVKIFLGKRTLEMNAQVSFDAEYPDVTSLDYFLAGLLGGVLLALLEQAKYKRIRIEDLEGRFSAKLVNPLTLLRVQGYDQAPDLQDARIVIYLYAEMEEEALLNFCRESLALSPVYRCAKKALDLRVDVKSLL